MEEDDPEVPKVTKILIIIKWTQIMEDNLVKCVGFRSSPLSYIIRKKVVRAVTVPPLATNLPHSTDHGLVEEELVARLNHQYLLYHADNEKFYYKVEEAVRGTIYAPTIKSFSRTKDGQGVLEALTKQFASTDKWQAELIKCRLQVTTSQWKEQSRYFLGNYANQYRNSHVSMQECATRVPFQLTVETTRVQHFFNEGQSNIPPRGMLYYFEAALAYILLSDPVPRSRKALSGGERGEVSGLSINTTPQREESSGGQPTNRQITV